MRRLKYSLFFLITGLLACQQSEMDQYHSLGKKRTSSNKKVNDIFFGYQFWNDQQGFLCALLGIRIKKEYSVMGQVIQVCCIN